MSQLYYVRVASVLYHSRLQTLLVPHLSFVRISNWLALTSWNHSHHLSIPGWRNDAPAQDERGAIHAQQVGLPGRSQMEKHTCSNFLPWCFGFILVKEARIKTTSSCLSEPHHQIPIYHQTSISHGTFTSRHEWPAKLAMTLVSLISPSVKCCMKTIYIYVILLLCNGFEKGSRTVLLSSP